MNKTSKRPVQLKHTHFLFLQLCCSDMTYREIGEEMGYSARTIDGFRDDLFRMTGHRRRHLLVLWAIKHEYVNLNEIDI
jgi:hypothetical protein